MFLDEVLINLNESRMEDKIVNRVVEGYKQRSKAGIKKYGTTLERNDLNTLDWLKHLQEELMDATLYIEALKRETTPEEILSYPRHKNCLITGVEMTEEDTYNINTGCPYSNFAEKFRSRHQIPVRDLRRFVEELKSKL